ncbi:hypothetical protein G7046_g6354 [Stylonectria norvegica]|nr:hypothetical protein G7046_g6354 [Stylonectria norvegica]
MDASNSSQPRYLVGNNAIFGSERQQFAQTKNASTSQTSRETPVPWNLYNFYSNDDSPWHPPIIPPLSNNGQPARRISTTGDFQANGPSFQSYRNQHLPSECDTLPEDSGYGGSGAPYSIENTSVFGEDRSMEAQATTQRIDSMHLGTAISSEAQYPTWSQPRPSTSVVTAPATADHRHYCSGCNTWLKTNKHKLRHERPFVCDVTGCRRCLEGFSTKNDLDRHKRSVHSDITVSGARFICRIGTCAAKDPPKLWPRADNFRSHLFRVHQEKFSADDNLEEYTYRQAPLRQALEGVGTAVSYLNPDPRSLIIQSSPGNTFGQSFSGNRSLLHDGAGRQLPEMQEALNSMLHNAPSEVSENDTPLLAAVQEDEEDYIQPDALKVASHYVDATLNQGSNNGLVASHCQPADGSCFDHDDSVMGHHATEESESCTRQTRSIVDTPKAGDLSQSGGYDSETDVANEQDSDDKTSNTDHDNSESTFGPSPKSLNSLPELGDPTRVLEFLKTLPKGLLESALQSETRDAKAETSTQNTTNNKNQHPCTKCSKLFNRPCELKKHQKRHEKPYGCTFISCSKVFGSKNDWKRHESSQHMQLETYRCEETRSNHKPCEKVFYRRASFKTHLQKEHKMEDAKQIEEKLDRRCFGRHCDTRFWCGFCRKVIDIPDDGSNGWTTRCDHIDAHFCGRDREKKRISDWTHFDPSKGHGDTVQQPGSRSPNAQSTEALTSSRGPNVKRKPNSDADMRLSKRARQDQLNYMWICCQCGTVSNMKTSASCIDCGHQRCPDYCKVECNVSHVEAEEDELTKWQQTYEKR